MSKGGSPMGSGGFGGQQQQGGFGGSFGMPQQQQQRGFSGGFQPSRQGFGGGFGMPQQQQGFGNTLARTTPPPQQPQQQGFGSSLGNFLGGQGFNMPQQMRNPMRPMVSRMASEQDQPSATPAPSTDMRAMMDPFRQQANQMMQPSGGRMVGFDPIMQQQQAQEREQLRQQGITPIDPNDPTFRDVAQKNRQLDLENQANYNRKRMMQEMQQPQTQMNQPPANPASLANAYQDFLRGMGGAGSGSQSVLGTPGGNLVGGGQQELGSPTSLNPMKMQQMEEQRQAAMPGNPYAQQVRQEDPRMQFMRNLQRMRFGGGGYNF